MAARRSARRISIAWQPRACGSPISIPAPKSARRAAPRSSLAVIPCGAGWRETAASSFPIPPAVCRQPRSRSPKHSKPAPTPPPILASGTSAFTPALVRRIRASIPPSACRIQTIWMLAPASPPRTASALIRRPTVGTSHSNATARLLSVPPIKPPSPNATRRKPSA